MEPGEDSTIETGITIPARGPLANKKCVRAMAEHAEALGFTLLAVPDHIVVPRAIASTYPYSETGEFPGASSGDCLDQFVLLAWLAALTSKPRLLTSVAVIPHRGAVQTAKMVATIDMLSEGRMILGAGAGWMKEEFEAIGAPPFEARGRVTDEYLQAFKVLWTEDNPRFDGRHVHFDGVSFLPKPVQKPHPPIWVGGESPAALRRTARYADTWYPIGTNPRHPLDTLPRLDAGIEALRDAAAREQRDPDSIGLAFFLNAFDESKPARMVEGERALLTGAAEEIAADVDALAERGVRDLVLNFQRGSLDATLASMKHFAERIRPLAKSIS
ncbi:MAG: LLM class F420-dependent oxidoreductase [Gammaproteobacteria bacterium]|nr:LLM class F420-dependent oxidoreductase [Gammaproteobacteria bacterium]